VRILGVRMVRSAIAVQYTTRTRRIILHVVTSFGFGAGKSEGAGGVGALPGLCLFRSVSAQPSEFVLRLVGAALFLVGALRLVRALLVGVL
jgi:hypothetical protein